MALFYRWCYRFCTGTTLQGKTCTHIYFTDVSLLYTTILLIVVSWRRSIVRNITVCRSFWRTISSQTMAIVSERIRSIIVSLYAWYLKYMLYTSETNLEGICWWCWSYTPTHQTSGHGGFVLLNVRFVYRFYKTHTYM